MLFRARLRLHVLAPDGLHALGHAEVTVPDGREQEHPAYLAEHFGCVGFFEEFGVQFRIGDGGCHRDGPQHGRERRDDRAGGQHQLGHAHGVRLLKDELEHAVEDEHVPQRDDAHDGKEGRGEPGELEGRLERGPQAEQALRRADDVHGDEDHEPAAHGRALDAVIVFGAVAAGEGGRGCGYVGWSLGQSITSLSIREIS